MAFRFETPYLDLEVYRLLAILQASSALARFDGSEEDKGMVEFLRNPTALRSAYAARRL